MSSHFKTIGLVGKYNDPHVGGTLLELYSFLAAKGCAVLVDEGSAHALPEHQQHAVSREELGMKSDLVIVVGGDGTLLNAARSLNEYEKPLLGINLGRLGFLVDVSPERMLETLEEIFQGIYMEERRFLLQSRIERQGEILSQSNAFNDVAIHKSHVARMIELECYVDNTFVTTIRADGLVISTPTGSTAYALSSGGPILHPTLDAIALVPICPHTLSNRPVVVGGDSRIMVRICEHEPAEVLVTCDGQIGLNLQVGDTLMIEKNVKPVRLIHPADHDYFEILRAKLLWGEKPRSMRP